MGVWGHERTEEPRGGLGECRPSSSPGPVPSLGGTYLVLSRARLLLQGGAGTESGAVAADSQRQGPRLGLEEEVGLGSPLGVLKGDFHPGASRYGGAIDASGRSVLPELPLLLVAARGIFAATCRILSCGLRHLIP